ncbi:unnamed protein product [Camellia sinensis]
MKIKERTQGIKKKFSHGRLKVTRHCLPDLSDMSSPSDLLLRLSVIRRVTRLRGICLESVFVNQPMCLPWRFRICQVIMVMRFKV